MRTARGQSILYVVLLMPTLILVLSLSIDIGLLQMHRLRLAYAADMATLSGASVVDTSYYRQAGVLRLDPGPARTVTRFYLERNLVQSLGSVQAKVVADAADISVVNDTPSSDPYTGRRLTRPSICARIRVPYRLSLVAFVGSLGTGRMSVAASAELRP